MSENIDPTIVARMNNLPELVNKPDQLQQQENIFDLINHLGDVSKNGHSINSDQKKDQDSSHMSSTPTDSQSQLESQSSEVDLIFNSIEPIQICKDVTGAELETSQSSDANSAALKTSRIPTGIPRPRVHSSSVKTTTSGVNNNTTSIKSSIPRMASSSKPPQVGVPTPTPSRTPDVPPKPVSSSGLKKPTPVRTLRTNNLTESTNTKQQQPARVSPRSFSRDVTDSMQKTTRKSIEETVSKPKRGTSLSAGISVNSLSSTNESIQSKKSTQKPKKIIRVAVRHKPRESKVKIFSQKVEIKNVSSKIGSLENYNHKPQGGDVVIQTHELNWNAQSKINSLEKAANYVPNGGNVKIENHKLNWQAKAKIGSLEKAATYVPHGGNVKIESHKLDFKSRARPKTDTGLVYIEDDDDEEEEDEEDYNSSQNVSGEYLNETQDLSA